jgi:hypothetical protein
LDVISILSPGAVVLQGMSSEKSKKVYSMMAVIESVDISSEMLNFGRDIDFVAWCGGITEYKL